MLCQPLNIVLYILGVIGILRLQLSNSGTIHQNLQFLVRMQFSKLALIFWLCTLAYAQSPVGSSGGGDTGSTTGNGNTGSNGAASSGAYPSISTSESVFQSLQYTALMDGIASSSTMSTSTVSSTTSPSPSASKASSADRILNPNLAVAGSFVVALGVAAMM